MQLQVVHFNPEKREFSLLLNILRPPYSMLGYNRTITSKNMNVLINIGPGAGGGRKRRGKKSILPNIFDDDCSFTLPWNDPLLSHITQTYLTITSPLSDRCPCMLTGELTASIKIPRTHFYPLPYYVTLCEDPDVDPLQILLKPGLKALQAQARIHTGFHRFTEIGQIFHNKIFLKTLSKINLANIPSE